MLLSRIGPSKRGIPRLTSPAEVIVGRYLFSDRLRQLREPGPSQAAVALEDSSTRAKDRLGGKGREFIAAVRLEKGAVRDAGPAQPVHAPVEKTLAGDAADD